MLGQYGPYPSALILDSSGDLFGTLNADPALGPPMNSTLFEVVKGSGKVTTLVTFGNVQASSLIIDAKGNLYGTLNPASGAAPRSSSFPREAHQDCHAWPTFGNSRPPPSQLTIDKLLGDLFGTTENQIAGSPTGIFELPRREQLTIKKLVDLTSTGGRLSALSVDSSGNLYGTLDEFNPRAATLRFHCL